MSSSAGLDSGKTQYIFKSGFVMPLWGLMVWIILMNSSMFNIALPEIISDLEITPATASWIATGYSVVLAISTLTYSRLSDFIPIRYLILVGMSFFGIASIIGFLSDNFGFLLLARVMQGAGAGASQGLGLVLVARYIPVYSRGRYMSWLSAGASMAFGMGPVIGGMLTHFFGWNYLFLISGLVLLVFPAIFRLLPIEPTKKGKFDIWGGVLLASGTTGLLLSLTTLSYEYLVVSVISYGLCWRHLHRVELPFIHPELLRNGRCLMIVYMGFSNFATHFSALFCLPILLSTIFKKESAEIGLLIFPGAMTAGFAAIFIVGRLIDRFGPRPVMITAHILLLSSTIMFSLLSGESPYYNMMAYLFMSLGFFSLTPSLGNELTRILPRSQVASGLGMLQLAQFFGSAFGVSVVGILITMQQNIPPKVAYHNIFLVIAGFVLVSGSILFLYLFLKIKRSELASEAK